MDDAIVYLNSTISYQNRTNLTQDDNVTSSTVKANDVMDPDVARRGWPAIVIYLICFTSLTGYAVYVYVILKHRAVFNNPFYHLSLSMLISDVTNILSEVIYSVPAMLFGESKMPDTFRIIVGYLCDGAWFWSSSHMAVIGINRVVAVCLYQKYQQWFNAKNVYIMMVCCWVYGFSMVSMMYACGCQYYFSPYTWSFKCTGSETCINTSLLINQIFSNSLVIIVVLSYVTIFIQVRRTSRKVKSTGKAADKKQKREIQLVIQFIVIGVVLSLYLLLFWIVPPLMEKKAISDYAGLNFMNIFGVLNSSIHPFMYIFFGSEVKSKIFVTSDDNDKDNRKGGANSGATKVGKKDNVVTASL